MCILYDDVFTILINREHIHVLGYSPKIFYVSTVESNKMFEKLKRNGIMDESLKYFIMKEDKLLELEVKSVCSQSI